MNTFVIALGVIGIVVSVRHLWIISNATKHYNAIMDKVINWMFD